MAQPYPIAASGNRPSLALAPHPGKDRYWPELDGLRAIAVSLVLMMHYTAAFLFQRLPTGPPNWVFAHASWWVTLGATGVDLFFVLSGFLVVGILLDQKKSPRFIKVFFARRVLRIFPLYFGLIGIWALLGLTGNKELEQTVPLPIYLFFLLDCYLAVKSAWGFAALSITWSLCIEERFYLIAPWIVRAVPTAVLAALLFFLGCGIPVLQHFAEVKGWNATVIRGSGLGWGGLVAIFYRSKYWNRLSPFALPLFLGGCLLLLALRHSSQIYSAFSIAYTILLIGAVAGTGQRWLAPLRLYAVRLIGRWSYAIYLFHQSVAVLVKMATSSWPQTGLVSLSLLTLATATTLLAAFLSWRYLESPCRSLGRRFHYDSPSPR